MYVWLLFLIFSYRILPYPFILRHVYAWKPCSFQYYMKQFFDNYYLFSENSKIFMITTIITIIFASQFRLISSLQCPDFFLSQYYLWKSSAPLEDIWEGRLCHGTSFQHENSNLVSILWLFYVTHQVQTTANNIHFFCDAFDSAWKHCVSGACNYFSSQGIQESNIWIKIKTTLTLI